MTSPVLCIDFGSSYTKVALRTSEDGLSRIMESEELGFDEARMCIPTVVATAVRNGNLRYVCGPTAADYVEGKSVKVYRNWKARLFAPEEPAVQAAPGSEDVPSLSNGRPSPLPPEQRKGKVDVFLDELAALGQRQQLVRELAALYQLPESQVAALADGHGLTLDHLRDSVRRLQPASAALASSSVARVRAPSTDPPAALPTRTGTTDLTVREVACEYFRWLHGFVARTCRSYGIPDINQVPVRVCAPVLEGHVFLGDPTPSEELLLEILQEAGWRLHEHHPLLPEPFADAIGVLTGGMNQTWVPDPVSRERRIHLSRMLVEGPLSSSRMNRLAPHVVLTVDVGAFTSDFAIVEFHIEADPRRPTIRTHSEMLGVEELDRRVQALLPPAQLERVLALTFRQREDLHKLVYASRKEVRLPGGNPGKEALIGTERVKEIQACIREFAAEIGERLDTFLGSSCERINELILTGGGNTIPAIAQPLAERLQGRGVEVVHMPSARKARTSTSHPLGPQLVRGGSALGGVSVYIDYEVP